MLAVMLTVSACAMGAPATTWPQTTQPAITRPPTTYAPSATRVAPTYTSRPPWERNLPAPTITIPAPAPAPGYAKQENTIGLATGGAKDISNFRENIENDYLPLPTDITYEGLFYDYYFDTGMQEATKKLFAPSYSYAVTRDPLSRQTEYYLSVGLNSGIRQDRSSTERR